MSISEEMRDTILGLDVAGLNAATGTSRLNDFVADVNAGASEADLAEIIASSADFVAIYPPLLTTEEFADKFLDNLVPGVDAAAKAEGVAAIEGILNGGGSIGSILLTAHNYLMAVDPADPAFGPAAQAYANRIAVKRVFLGYFSHGWHFRKSVPLRWMVLMPLLNP